MHKVLIFLTLFVCGATVALGQAKTAPSIYLEVSDSAIADNVNWYAVGSADNNVFDKPNDQRELVHFGMARKRGMKSNTFYIPPNLRRVTNFNHSVDLGCNVAAFIYDSLRTDRTATVVTVYETDADSTVGLWEIGSGVNRVL